MTQIRLLFIDAYDSFSNNIVSLIKDQLAVDVESVRIDDPRFTSDRKAWFRFLDDFDGVVAGPGPGHPATPDDVGLIASLWSLPDEHILPVLGVCLGFQSLTLAFGAKVERLRQPRHGLVTPVTHCQRDVFDSTGEILATQYHSLRANAHHDTRVEPKSLWRPSTKCPELIPLAWDLSDEENGPILMSAKHCHKPFWGVQYHLESICTNTEGHRLISSWWQAAQRFNVTQRFRPQSQMPRSSALRTAPEDEKSIKQPRAVRPLTNGVNDLSANQRVQHITFPASYNVDAAGIVELVRRKGHESTLLESGTRNGKPLNPETGRFSIIGLQENANLRVRYSCTSRKVVVEEHGKVVSESETDIADVFGALDDLIKTRSMQCGPADLPFWGGLVGYVSYEAGLETLDVANQSGASGPADLWFTMVERSIIIDHVEGAIHVQSIRRENDHDWLQTMRDAIVATENSTACAIQGHPSNTSAHVVSEPAKHEYCAKVVQSQDYLRAGESYEICLTDQTRISSEVDPWSLYRNLRQTNPAPFGAFMHLRSSTAEDVGINIVGSSPERFLSWSREGRCEFRPIKGTVKKTPEMTREKAEALLSIEKEQAENLMIVDLIRHDLSGVAGVQDVSVPKLMTVEEYETVFQLVSVIQGHLPSPDQRRPSVTQNTLAAKTTTGIDVLKSSLPPGSMTGAPKKRSCELLQSLENQQPRGLYSGVLGYLDVGGGGDFSVVIRTAFKWDGQDEPWRIGAGGAVTVLSEAEAEFEEMEAKRERLVDVFASLNVRRG